MAEVVTTDEFLVWYEALDERHKDEIDYLIGLLEEKGVTLRYPYSSAIEGIDEAFRELRGTVGKAEPRVIYAFDPRREAVLLIGGDKAGDKRFYDWIVPKAQAIWAQYLTEQGF